MYFFLLDFIQRIENCQSYKWEQCHVKEFT